MKSIIKNLLYSFSTNMLVLVTSAILILVLPKILTVQDYGYWQLYLLYLTYVGFGHLGWNDGIYLKWGGRDYEELNRKAFYSQFWLLFVFQLILLVILMSLITYFDYDQKKIFILKCVFVAMVLVNTRNMLVSILQATNRIKEFALINNLDRISLLIGLVLLFIFNNTNLKIYLFIDLLSKAFSLIYAIIICKDITLLTPKNFINQFFEIFENLSTGVKLLVANISNLLIIGIIRLGIELNWNIVVFAQISLILSISTTFLIFFNAMSIVLFPVLRKTKITELKDFYIYTNRIYFIVAIPILILFLPLYNLFEFWLPEYRIALMYFSVLFPIFLIEGRVNLLLFTYLKTLRLENKLFKINIYSVLLSILSITLSTIIFNSLNMAVFSILVTLIFRSLLADKVIQNEFGISDKMENFKTLSIIFIFIISIQFFNKEIMVLIILLIYISYFIYKFKFIKDSILYFYNKRSSMEEY
ncbi:hypothetical protein CQS04_07135 [Chryseomicrobium excrementi]|uniref:Polysaccharide biosynthesis protein n=1 Tax=Chryseomicrobium excrementi TaxID=2041346 RepID=A0A2M9F0D7_9BACL|nr:hypothetical protein [Chryseomicrobium excrementi]PJK16920.1 hypothetical protein CQS04_07135 [Chryseomicrobium excrementi]